MRTLHRPMFRYGGPIKEGVMSGIREPRQNYKLGSEVTKRVGMRIPAFGAHYNKGIANLGKLWEKIKGWTGSTAQYTPVTKVTKPPVTKWSGGYHGTTPGGITYQASGPVQNVWTPKGWVARDPIYKLGSQVYKGRGYIGKPIKWGYENIVATPTGGIGLVYLGGKWLTRDGKPANENEINEHLNTGGGKSGGVPGGGDQGMRGDGSWFAEQEKIAADKKRAERIQKYRDIMDIKGMNKEAAYDSLIAASQAINESGDFKGDIKSGKLINQIIQGASKAFDKPKKTKDAIDTLILKGEIEKDIKASDPSNKMLNELRLLQGKKIKEELNPSFTTLKAVHSKAGKKGQSGIDDAASEYATNNGVDFKGNIISKSDFSETLKDLKEKTGGLDEDVIITNWTNEIIKGKNTADGAYTVGDKIVIIKDSQVISVE